MAVLIKQEGNMAIGGRGDMRSFRKLTIFMFTFTQLQQVPSEFAPATVFVTCVLHYASNKFEVSTAFQFRVNFRHGMDGQTDGQGATLYRPDRPTPICKKHKRRDHV